jgi:hypothetical protein
MIHNGSAMRSKIGKEINDKRGRGDSDVYNYQMREDPNQMILPEDLMRECRPDKIPTRI